MASETRSRRADTTTAFTLIELLLTVALVLLFAGAVILNFGSLDSNARLENGASQVETLFRYARAQAANTGRQVRIVFGSIPSIAGGTTPSTNLPPILASTNAGVQVLWEPDPIQAPGRFEALPGAELLLEQVNDLVQVRQAGQPGAFQTDAAGLGTASPPLFSLAAETNSLPSSDVSTNSMPPLTCYPDGSSDSMELVLAAASGDDKRLAVVTLFGLGGTSRHRFITPTTDGLLPSDDGIEPDPAHDR